MNYIAASVCLPVVRETTGEKVRTPEDVLRICADMRSLAQETFQVLTLNARNMLINRHLVSLGLVNAALVHAREVFRPAILDGASGVLLAHNHCSGDPTPSAEDVRQTAQLVKAGALLGIPVLDHIVIGDGCVSMRETGVCSFKT